MHELGRLISDRMSHPDNQWSLQGVVDRMRAAGHDNIGKSRLAQIQREPVISIKADVIFALAAGLGVTPLTVATAALASMGINPRPAEVTDAVATIQIDPTLSDANRQLLITMVRQMRQESETRPTPRRGQLRAVARTGNSLGRQLRDAQDDDAYAPDPPGNDDNQIR